jgi:hypothetical protein
MASDLNAAVPSTVAVDVAKFTVAPETPGVAVSAFSTWRTQDAQVIPVTA